MTYTACIQKNLWRGERESPLNLPPINVCSNLQIGEDTKTCNVTFPYWELIEILSVVYKPSVKQPPLLVELLTFFILLRWYDRYVALLKMSLSPLKWK